MRESAEGFVRAIDPERVLGRDEGQRRPDGARPRLKGAQRHNFFMSEFLDTASRRRENR